MPFTSLNKLIAIIIVGIIPLIGLGIAFYPKMESGTRLSPFASDLPAGAAYLLVFLAAATISGLVLDGIADLISDPFNRCITSKGCRGRLCAGFFLKRHIQSSYLWWENVFFEAVKSTPYASLSKLTLELVRDESEGPKLNQRMAAGIFQRHANKEVFDWFSYHYSVYSLSRAAAVGISLLTVEMIFVWPHSFIYIIAGGFIVTYIFISLAVDNFLYSYVLTFRLAAIICIVPPTAVVTIDPKT